MVWMYIILSLLLLVFTTLFYLCVRFLPWLYRVQVTIRNSHRPFLVVEPHWLFGHLFSHGYFTEQGLRDSIAWMKKSKEGVYAHFLPVGQSLVFSHPRWLKKVLNSSEPKGLIPATGSSYKLMIPWIGDGLLTSSGKKWSRNRRLLTPAFHFDVLRPYMDIYNSCTEKLIGQIHHRAAANTYDGRGKQQSIEIFRLLDLFTLNVILRCAFSVEDDVQELGDTIPYVRTVRQLGKSITERLLKPHWLIDGIYFYFTSQGRRFRRLCDYSHAYALKMIRSRKAQLETEVSCDNGKRYKDFLDLLLLARDESGGGPGLTEGEIRDEAETFLFEAHDTTSCGIAWLLYNLARHWEIQARAQREVDSLLVGRKSDEMKWDDLTRMPYLTRCIKESLRTHPPVPAVNRELTKPMEVSGHMIPAGSVVQVHIHNVHHNPDLWGENCDEYDPDRFLPPLKKGPLRDPYAFIPFSAGQRNCIGRTFAMNEIKTTAARILQKFDLVLDESHPVRIRADLVLRAESGIKLYFRPRQL